MMSVLSSFSKNYLTPSAEDKTEPKNGLEGKTEPKIKNKLGTLNTILSIIQSDPRVTISVLVQKSGKSRTTVQSCLKVLKETNRIARSGGNKGGQWIIL